MVTPLQNGWFWITLLILPTLAFASQQEAGSIRGLIMDADFDVPLAGVKVQAISADSTIEIQSDAQGTYLLSSLPPGPYTLVFSKAGYQRSVQTQAVVLSGQVSKFDASLAGEYTDMEEFVVEDMLGGVSGSEEALLELRFEGSALIDSIGSDLMSKAGFSNAAQALQSVPGASLVDGKTAVVRGLPDRYVSSQLNGIRLPSSDDDKRAVELDLFPSAVIDSLQVSKTFTPDQQGDASGGAVDVRLKGVPADVLLNVSFQSSHNTQVTNSSLYRSYDGGGVNFWGDSNNREIQFENLGDNWLGAAGTRSANAPLDYKTQLSFGERFDYEPGIVVGGFVSFFYERDSSLYDDEQDNSLWMESPGAGLTPEIKQGEVGADPQTGNFTTGLFDITRSSESVKWGGLATMGVETDRHAVNLYYLYTHIAQDKAIVAEDTRGKEYYFPGYDINDPMAPGNLAGTTDAAPYIRSQTLEYTERTAGSLQLHGDHTLGDGLENPGDSSFAWLDPELSWSLADSFSDSNQPDKRQFAARWTPPSFSPGVPPFTLPGVEDPFYLRLNPAANTNLGNFQRIWKLIEEDSQQFSFDLTFPFERWGEGEGYLKFGAFDDSVDRRFGQDTFSNFGDLGPSPTLDWTDYWTDIFPNEDHPVSASETDVDYDGTQDITAWYGMLDMPLDEKTNLLGGVRFEDTTITTTNDPEADAVWFPPGVALPVQLGPGDGNVDFSQDDALPSIALIHKWTDEVTVRLAYAQTVARQTFKELTPIVQQEFLGGPIFIGRPDLQMSELENYDVRVDYAPAPGSLVSLSYFEKSIDQPIEYIQTAGTFSYTTPINYPKGELRGIEAELRQDLGTYTDAFEGISIGLNGTWIDSEVTLTAGEIGRFDTFGTPIETRQMVQAPENLYNLFLTYDSEDRNTQFGLFYTLQGDTLVAGAGLSDGNFIPDVYAAEFDSLNLTFSQKLGGPWKLKFQAKNLTNPLIEEVYRSPYIGEDVTHTSYHKGIDYSLAISASLSF